MLLLTATAIMFWTSSNAYAETVEWVCPTLLMDFECAQYQQRLKLADSDAQRDQTFREYAVELAKRRRACRVTESAERQVALLRAPLQRFGRKE